MSVSGNHSRVDTKDRALAAERLDDLVEPMLRARLKEFDNISLDLHDRIDPTMYIAEIRGQTYVGVHGDFDDSPAKVQSLVAMAERPVSCILAGHLHHNSTNIVNGVKVVMAGSFLGSDDYCIGHRIFGWPQQMVCVVSDKGVKCHYDVFFEKDGN
jgi:predicted phosphodiesterase